LHDHPPGFLENDYKGPSGLMPWDTKTQNHTGDISVVNEINNRFPNNNITFQIYDVFSNYLITYNATKILNESFKFH